MLWVSLFVLVVYCVSDSFLIRSVRRYDRAFYSNIWICICVIGCL